MPGVVVRWMAVVATVALWFAACTSDDRPRVETQPVSSGEVTQTISAPATVQAAARQDVAASVSGVVVRLRVRDGERVRKGQEILRLTSSQVDLAREQARAAEAAAAGAGAIAVDGNGDATLAAAHRAVDNLDESTRPRLRQARRRARRIDDREQRQAALAAVAAVEASYESTRSALLTAGRTVAVQQDATAASLSRAVEQAVAGATAAQRLQAESAARVARSQAEALVVRAPFGGMVQLGEAAASDGTPVSDGVPPELEGLAGSFGGIAGGDGGGTLRVGAPVLTGQTLFSVFDLSDVYVKAEVDEVDAPQAKPGQRAAVTVDAFADSPLEGIVERIAVASAPTAAGGVGYPAHIRLIGLRAGPGERLLRRLRVGMSASADIVTRTRTSDLVVPSRALLRRDGRDVVFAVRDRRAEEIVVDVIALGEETAAVAGDLDSDDEVIVTGYEDLDDGAEVVAD
ncbi:MAG: HlyD family efflux transporter periplasmic adaptor subunit [Nitriliruptorales bacterium]|nr:HlyD family efflux transporter periplasmic adaptor subunit [Nitriliruptorales bacterium]